MKTLLLINGCVRGEYSRTKKLAKTYIEKLNANGEYNVVEKDLNSMNLSYLTSENFDAKTGEHSIKSCELAKEFASADEIILATPFWEFMFPAVVSCYFEEVSVVGTTFVYTEHGSVGLCKANKFTYIYTAGDYLTEEDKFSEKYLKKLTSLYGIKEFESISLCGLDIKPNDSEKMVADKCEEILRG